MKKFLLTIICLFPLSSYAASLDGGWIENCPYDHSRPDDPIKFPGAPGFSHLHDFFGSKTTNSNSTYGSMNVSPTTCGSKGDTSGYWVPALYRNNVRVLPAGHFGPRSVREKWYYREDHYGTGIHVEPFPPDFKMVQGYGDAKSIAEANAHGAGWGHSSWWGCSDNSISGKSTVPVNCKIGVITVHVTFPSCWDGVKTLGDEVASGHVKFPSNQVCPTGFKRALPMLIARLEYPVGPSSSGITVASGALATGTSASGPPYTFHADFWNTWLQAGAGSLTDFTNRCLNANVNCGTDP